MTRLLLVIDAQAERRMIARLCVRFGITPVEVSSIAAARQLLHAEASAGTPRDPNGGFSAAMIDANLSDGPGLGLLAQLRLPPHPCAMVLLGGDEELETFAGLALSLGVHRLLRKPFAADGFESAINSASKRTAEYRRWLDPETVGERHDSWLQVLMATDPEVADARGSAPGFLERMARVVVARGQLSPAEARLVPDLLLGRDYNSIAAVHGVSSETVRSHVKAVLGKLNLSSAKQLWQVCVAELDG